MSFWKVKYLSIVIGLALIAGVVFTGISNASAEVETKVLGVEEELKLKTESKFEEEVISKEEAVKFETEEVKDEQMEIGKRRVVQEGKNGIKKVETRVMYYEGEKYDEVSFEEVIKEPVTEIVTVGIKVIVKELKTDNGVLKYAQKMLGFWATSYDSTCPGCSSTTATGMKQGYGVVAVDPKVIVLGTRLYVPGYGIGVAGDVGGAIKGKKIDLGYDSLMGQWSSRYVDVYILVD